MMRAKKRIIDIVFRKTMFYEKLMEILFSEEELIERVNLILLTKMPLKKTT